MMCNSPNLILCLAFAFAFSVQSAPPRAIHPNPSHLSTSAAADANLYWSPGDHQLIVNGDFETGNLNGWSRLNEGGDTAINNGSYDPNSPDGPLPPIAGNFGVVNDQNGPGFQMLFQDITIPADATSAVLTWSDRIRNHNSVFANTAPLQRFKVEIRNTNNAPLALIYSTEPGDVTLANPAKRSADITGFSGQRIRLTFITEQNQFFFNVHLDNVSVLVKSPGTQYDVYFGTNSTPGTNQFLGTTTNTTWDLPPLQPFTTYYWRLISRQGSEQTTGSVWQFRTPAIGPVHHFQWGPLPSPQVVGQPFSATVTARDQANFVVTNFNETVLLSALTEGEPIPQSILGSEPYTAYASHDRATVGYSFTPVSDMLVTGVRHTSGEKISVWSDAGTLVDSQPISGLPGSLQHTVLSRPFQLYAGQRYRLGVYSGGLSTNFARFDLPAAFAHGTIHQSYEGLGDAFPATSHPARWWLVDLVYEIGAREPVAVVPAAATFVNGVWTGNLRINDPAERLRLCAEDSAGHGGRADPVSILAIPAARFTAISLTATNLLLTFTTVPGKTYQLDRTDNLAGNNWTTVLPNLQAQSNTMQVSDASDGQRQFYRVLVLP